MWSIWRIEKKCLGWDGLRARLLNQHQAGGWPTRPIRKEDTLVNLERVNAV